MPTVPELVIVGGRLLGHVVLGVILLQPTGASLAPQIALSLHLLRKVGVLIPVQAVRAQLAHQLVHLLVPGVVVIVHGGVALLQRLAHEPLHQLGRVFVLGAHGGLAKDLGTEPVHALGVLGVGEGKARVVVEAGGVRQLGRHACLFL